MGCSGGKELGYSTSLSGRKEGSTLCECGTVHWIAVVAETGSHIFILPILHIKGSLRSTWSQQAFDVTHPMLAQLWCRSSFVRHNP